MSTSTRFVITEFFRKPDEDFDFNKIWYHKNTNIIKRIIIYYPDYLTDKFYDKDGELHKDNDEPAIITSEGEMHYYLHGNRHRGHYAPAIIWSDGRKEYYVHGELRFKTADLRVSNSLKKA